MGVFCWECPAIDHIVPFSKGGKTVLSNAALTGSNINYNLKDFENKEYKYENSLPNISYFYETQGMLKRETQIHIMKFLNLEQSDFYYNNALKDVFFACEYKMNPYSIKGKKKDRNEKYYLSAALNQLTEWNQKKKDNYLSFEKRKLIDKDLLEKDQKILLKFRTAKSLSDMRIIFNELYPYYCHNQEAYSIFLDCYENCIISFYNEFSENKIKNINVFVDSFFQDFYDQLNNKYCLPRLKLRTNNVIVFLKKYFKGFLKIKGNKV